MADRATKPKVDAYGPVDVELIGGPGGSADLAVILDEASATVTYVGKAAVGSATSAAVWKIQKLDSATGLVVTWAGGTAEYDKVWDDRAVLTYS